MGRGVSCETVEQKTGTKNLIVDYVRACIFIMEG